MEERSLDDFLDAGGAETDSHEAERSGDSGTDDAASSRDHVEADADDAEPAQAPDGDSSGGPDEGAPVAADSVDPAVSTYGWGPDGGTCAACGATVERRWRGEDGLVCPDCKSW
jgi:hypothetical protein